MASGSEDTFWTQDPEVAASTDVELLKRAWRNEKASPEILRFEGPLVERVREQIELLEQTVEELRAEGKDELMISLYQMDLDRTLYLLRSYLRIRLQKIEKYTIHISKTDLWARLSSQEQAFAQRCIIIMKEHLEQSVLGKLPDGYKDVLKQSLASEDDDMVPEPPLDTFVFCKSRGDLGPFQLDDSDNPIDMVADDLWILRYKQIKELVHNGRIDLF
ncbi:hypothetical protein AMTRI_Chr10g231580 [Amborella trichopoda]